MSFGHVKNLPPPIGRVFPFEIRECIKAKRVILGRHKDFDFGNLTISYLGKNFIIPPKAEGSQIIYDLLEMIPPAGSFSLVEQVNIFRINLAFRPNKCVNLLSNDLVDLKIYFEF